MVKLFVEGGGDSNSLKTECRRGFTSFISKAGITRKPRIVACGSRRNAYESFCTEIANGGDALLCKKGPYGKGAHSFGLLAQINPDPVLIASPWAKRLVDALKSR